MRKIVFIFFFLLASIFYVSATSKVANAVTCSLDPRNPRTIDTITYTAEDLYKRPYHDFMFVLEHVASGTYYYNEPIKTDRNGIFQKQFSAPPDVRSKYRVYLLEVTSKTCPIEFAVVSPSPGVPTPTPMPSPTPNPTLIPRCPICDVDYHWVTDHCEKFGDPHNIRSPKQYLDCSSTGQCFPGCGCNQYVCLNIPTSTPAPPPPGTPYQPQRCKVDNDPEGGVQTAVGCIPTDPGGLVSFLLRLILGFSGGIALLLIIFSGYRMATSAGNPEALQGARETLTSAVVGLVFIILAIVILRIIGVEILRIPGFGE